MVITDEDRRLLLRPGVIDLLASRRGPDLTLVWKMQRRREVMIDGSFISATVDHNEIWSLLELEYGRNVLVVEVIRAHQQGISDELTRDRKDGRYFVPGLRLLGSLRRRVS